MHRVSALVGLEMADHVPAQLARTLADLDLRFLDAVLAEDGQPELGGGSNPLRWLALGDSEQAHARSIAMGALACRLDLAMNALKIGGKVHGADSRGAGFKNKMFLQNPPRGW